MLSPARGAAGSASTKARRPAVGTIDQRGSAASEEQPVISGAAPPAVIKIEQRGIEFVPLDHRWGKPAGLFWMWAGAVWNVEFVLSGALAVSGRWGFAAGIPAKVIFLLIAVAIQAVLPTLGHAAVLKVLRWLAIPFVLLFALMAILTTSKVNLHVPAHGAGWGSLLVFLALVISAGGLGWTENASDYSRYLSPTADKRRIVLAVALGGAIPSALLEILGAAVATGVPD